MIELKAGDIFATKGNGWISKAIRFCSKKIGESRTEVNHVGLIHTPGTPPCTSVGIEALHRVKQHTLLDQYQNKDTDIYILRPKNLDRDQLTGILNVAQSHVGKKYGYVKIGLHLLDWALLGAYVFRRFGRMKNYPICSWLVDDAYRKGAGLNFGVAQAQCQPDDIWDFAIKNPDKYEVLGPFRCR